MNDTTRIRIAIAFGIPVSFAVMVIGTLSQQIQVFAVGVAMFALAFALLFLTEARHALDRRTEPP